MTKNYSHWLISVIEAYTKNKLNQNPKTFDCRGMNLRYAVERLLYLNCINSEALQECHSKNFNNLSKKITRRLTNLDREILSLNFGGLKFPQVSGLRLRDFPAYFLLRWLYGWFIFFKSKIKNRDSNKPQRCHSDVLIGVIDPKFIYYLAAITNKLAPYSFAYFVPGKSNVEAFNKMKGAEIFFVQKRAPNLAHFLLSSSIKKNYYGLVEVAEELYSQLKKSAPKSVLVVEGGAPEDAIISEVCRSLAIPVFCVQQGWSPIIHNGFRNMSFDAMFLWGQGFEKLLQPFNPFQKFIVTGSHVMKRPKTKISIKNDPALRISFFLQMPSWNVSTQTYRDFIELMFWTAKNFSKIAIVVREHPNYPMHYKYRRRIEKFKNIEFSSPSNSNLSDVIMQSDLVVSIYSTTILEAIFMGVVLLICSIGTVDQYGIDLKGAAIEVKTISEAKEWIRKINYDPAILQEYARALAEVSEEYFFCTDNSAEFIAAYIISTMSAN